MDTFFDSMLDSQQPILSPPPPPPPTPQMAEQALDDFMSSFLDPVPHIKRQDLRQKPKQAIKRKILETPSKKEPSKKIERSIEPPKKLEIPKTTKEEIPKLILKIPCPKSNLSETEHMAVIPAVNVTIFMSCGTEGCRSVEVKQPE